MFIKEFKAWAREASINELEKEKASLLPQLPHLPLITTKRIEVLDREIFDRQAS